MPAKITPLTFLNARQRLFGFFSFLVVGSILLSLGTGKWYFLLAPALFLLILTSLVNFKAILFLLYACVPLSTLVYLPGGFSTDLPTEPLMVGLMLITLLYGIRSSGNWERRFLFHPITALFFLHWLWIGISGLTGTTPIISLKFWLAKTWYLFAFYLLTGWVLTREKDQKRWFWLILVSLCLTTLYVQIGHAGFGFSFSSIKKVLAPFYANHVIYASVLAVFFPFLWYMRLEYREKPIWNAVFWLLILFFLAAIYLSYTRAAYVSLLVCVGVYLFIRWRLVAYGFLAALLVGLLLWVRFSEDNAYLELAPNYETTISHDEFGDLLQATYEMEDISTMERLYRWMAGFQMIGARPWVGFGPGSFYERYKPFTIRSFQTYVSDNPERSGIHSYYLMAFVEQGVVGFLLFLFLQLVLLLYGQRLYHRTAGWEKRLVLMTTLSLAATMTLQLINDLLETDKVGSFYFFCAAMLVGIDLRQKRSAADEEIGEGKRSGQLQPGEDEEQPGK
jgi:O-antigen ligase